MRRFPVLILVSLCYLLLATLASAYAQGPMEEAVTPGETENITEEEITATRIRPSTKPEDLHARSEFRSSQLVANQYLAVTLELTKTSMEVLNPRLMRGPAVRNSAIDDLRVRMMQDGKVHSQYSIQDTRFRKRQRGSDLGDGYEWFIQEPVEITVFIPLDESIDKVSIIPSPGREGVVANGDEFDPRPLAAFACRERDYSRYPDCENHQYGPD